MLGMEKEYIDSKLDPMCCVFTYSNLKIPNYLVIKNKSLLLDVVKFTTLYNQIKKLK